MADALKEYQIIAELLMEAFSLVGKDFDDGFITIEEEMVTITKEKVQEMIGEALIIDENGSMSFEDFLSIMRIKMKENLAEELKDSFKVFDRDNDGYISATELRHVMMKMGERLTDEEVEEMIREADLDGDGQVSYEEFARIVMLN